jgi:hypothetical protein
MIAGGYDQIDLPPIEPVTTRINLYRAVCVLPAPRHRGGAGRQARSLAVLPRERANRRSSARLPANELQATDRSDRRHVRRDDQ